MKGILLDYSLRDDEGLILGDDGERYLFLKEEWRSDGAPIKGVRVDFDLSEGVATSVYLLPPEVPKMTYSPGPSVMHHVNTAHDVAAGVGAGLAMHRSFVGKAFGVLFAYILLYPAGLILNIIFKIEADGIKNRTGVSPQGQGCLHALFLVFFIIPLVIIAFLAVGIFSGTMSLPHLF